MLPKLLLEDVYVLSTNVVLPSSQDAETKAMESPLASFPLGVLEEEVFAE